MQVFPLFCRSRVWMWLPSIRSKLPLAPRVLLLLQTCINKISGFEQTKKKKVVSLFLKVSEP